MSTTAVPEDFAGFVRLVDIVVYPISTLSVMFFVYGFYVLIFGACIHLMRRGGQDNGRQNPNLYLWLAVILFVLSTVFVVDYAVGTVRDTAIRFNAVRTGDYDPLFQYLTQDTQKTILLELLPNLLIVLLNIAAEYMLIHRCYVIWGSRKRIAIPLILVSVGINALGLVGCIMITIGSSDTSKESNLAVYYLGDTLTAGYTVGSLILNSILTLLTAARIWWIHRQVRACGTHGTDTFVGTVSRIIIESGTIYPLIAIVQLITANTVSDPNSLPFDLYTLIPLSAGIAPTLIMVRARLAKNVENFPNVVSDIRFTSGPTPCDDISTVRSQTQVLHSARNLTLNFGGRHSERSEDGKEDVVV